MKQQKITKSFILKSSIIIMIATLLSKLLGLVREQLALYLFGGSHSHDAFIAAYKLPNALRNLLAEGAFSAAFIPIFSSLLVNKSKEEAFDFANKVITLLFFTAIIITGLGILFAPNIIPVIYKHDARLDLAIQLSRIMMPFLIFVSISAIIMGILNSLHHFLFPALAPLFGNVIFIITLILLYGNYGIKSLAIAILASGVFYFLSQTPSLAKKRFRFKFNFKFRDSNVKRFLKSFFPIAFGMAIFQLNLLVSIRFSSPFEGAVVAIDKTFIILQLILSVFVTGISTVSLPTFSRYIAENKNEKFKETFIVGIRMVLFFTVPAMIGLMALNTDVASMIYRDIFQMVKGSTGKIKLTDIINMGNCLFFFAPGMVSFGCVVILNRAFQGLKKYYIPFFTGIVSIITNIILINLFINTSLKFIGIPLSISISSWLNMILLSLILRIKSGKFPIMKLIDSAFKVLLASAIMGALVRLLKKRVIFLHFVEHTGFEHLFYTLLLILTGIFIYTGILFLLKEKDLILLWNKIKSHFSSKKQKTEAGQKEEDLLVLDRIIAKEKALEYVEDKPEVFLPEQKENENIEDNNSGTMKNPDTVNNDNEFTQERDNNTDSNSNSNSNSIKNSKIENSNLNDDFNNIDFDYNKGNGNASDLGESGIEDKYINFESYREYKKRKEEENEKQNQDKKPDDEE